MMHPYKKYLKFIIVFTISLAALIAQNNNVKSVTDKAMKDYQDGNYSSAISGMETALDLMKKRQNDEYSKLLPQALPGWIRGEDTFRTMDPRSSEKGLLIEQTYNKGNGYIKATLIINAPMINDVKRVLSSKQSSTSRDGFSFESIANKNALIRYYDNQNKGEITILASNTTIAAVYGENVTLREMKNYARLFKFSEIDKVK